MEEQEKTRKVSQEKESDLFQDLQCFICLDFARDTRECNSCHNILCYICSKQQLEQCPYCRTSPFIIQENSQVKRMIDQISCECPNKCDSQLQIGDIQQHIQQCSKRKYQCSVGDCQFKGLAEQLIEHISSLHKEQILNQFCINVSDPLSIYEKDDNQFFQSEVKNDKGRNCQLGKYGLFYCGNQQEFNCNCCDGFCGPVLGCCCISCMQLNMEKKKVKQGYFLNLQGAVCKQQSNGNYYCGRRALKQSEGNSGYCGPISGPACRDCKLLKQNMETIYQTLV